MQRRDVVVMGACRGEQNRKGLSVQCCGRVYGMMYEGDVSTGDQELGCCIWQSEHRLVWLCFDTPDWDSLFWSSIDVVGRTWQARRSVHVTIAAAPGLVSSKTARSLTLRMEVLHAQTMCAAQCSTSSIWSLLCWMRQPALFSNRPEINAV